MIEATSKNQNRRGNYRLHVDLSKVELPARRPFRYSNLFIAGAVLFIVWYSANGAKVALEPFLDSRNQKQVANFVSGLFPPDLSPEFLSLVWQLTVETFQISVIGTVLAIVLGFPLSLLAMRQRGEDMSREATGTGRWMVRGALYYSSRTLLNIARAVPELIWALIAIIFVGLGPFAGVVALTIHSAGILGKLYAEIFEAVDQRLVETVRNSGANELQTLFFARIPLTLPVLLSYTMFRWECNMRAATVLGFVAAGGLGSQLRVSMNTYNYPQVTTLIIALLILVTLVDLGGQFLRRRILDVPEVTACRPEPAELLAK
ncbi:MAG TPA: phosphonate ABC transporter, permease protein PhnE [Chloroflexia bacterium]|nr:phosphonate ABC transporter, permease protein PhnE [Chloroflexia bacterium]